MRDYKKEIQDQGMECRGDFENWRLGEHEDCECLGCPYDDYCASVLKAAQEAKWKAKTPEERAQHEAMIKGLRELY